MSEPEPETESVFLTPQAVLREKLLYAIHFCKSIDTDDYARVAMTAQQAEEDDTTT